MILSIANILQIKILAKNGPSKIMVFSPVEYMGLNGLTLITNIIEKSLKSMNIKDQSTPNISQKKA